MSWGPEVRKKVFDFYLQGSPEKEIVKVLRRGWSVDEKTVRRCLTGLDMIEETTESADGIKDRFERLGGTEHYLVDLRRAYSAYKRRELGDNFGGSTAEHRKTLNPPLADLQGIGPIEIHDLDLATLYSRPADPIGPLARVVCGESRTGAWRSG